jgi:hypothetical protein
LTEPHRRGDVRLRSNVVLIGNERAGTDAWKLVPGEIVGRFKPGLVSPFQGNQRQQRERMYYTECGECHRLNHQIERDGCSHPRCSHPPPEASVAATRARHEQALQLIQAELARLESQTIETERPELEPLLEPEAAVARFLGLEAIVHPETKEEAAETLPPHTDGRAETPVADLARKALAQAAARTGRFADSYCDTPIDNLIGTITLGQARSALDQLGGGDGGELIVRAGKLAPKFCAAYSSSALAVNTFAPWLGHEKSLVLVGRSGFAELAFEVRFPTGLQGNPPNLDVVAQTSETLVAIESKCLEYLGEHEARFQQSYDDVVVELAHESWIKLFQDLKRDPRLLSRLGVGQLMRHYLGLRRAIVNGETEAATLLYIFWEPENASSFDEFAAHRNDLDRLMQRVSDPTVRIAAASYPELWQSWAQSSGPDWLTNHLLALRQRYTLRLA